MSLVARSLETLARDVVLLAPPNRSLSDCFRKVDHPLRHQRLLRSMQKLRGEIYLGDGAIERWQLLPDGRHEQPIDYESWHILALDDEGKVSGCVRYHEQSNKVSFQDLGVRQSALAVSPWWGKMLRVAIENELAAARLKHVAYVEVGGWAIAAERRCSPEALRLVMVTYALAQLLGGCRGITTATVRHHSSTILRKLGGRPLEVNGCELPAYYDPMYRCDMEILQFDSRSPGAFYAEWVDQIRTRLPLVPVVCSTEAETRRERPRIPAGAFPAMWRAPRGVTLLP